MSKKERRFRDLVKASGRPEVVTLWEAPQKNREFMQAVRENRVLTVIQEPRSKRKEFGLIGYHRKPHAAYLVFPRPLKGEAEFRVVGINYEWVRRPGQSAGGSAKNAVSRSKPSRVPSQHEYNVIVRRLAVLETSVPVRARHKREAANKARELVVQQPFDLSKAILRHEIKAVG